MVFRCMASANTDGGILVNTSEYAPKQCVHVTPGSGATNRIVEIPDYKRICFEHKSFPFEPLHIYLE